ncbi:hypothetical protein CMO90_01805 [Candidatus Woesearchaeota archaeon]|nr:hypothetical protein [Candidatus Woesearchaeota archaeon]|tara:strand:- start:2967 stop:4181 length:1215 start_codon:yes stop_codon:yes gene_type:complete
MKKEYLRYALNNIMYRKLRSWLTVVSILIGIGAIFALVSFGVGLSRYVDILAAESGSDKLIVQAKGIGAPGADENFFVSKEEVDFLRDVNGIKEIAGLYGKIVEINYDKQKKYVYLVSKNTGEEEKLVEEIYTIGVEKGRDLENGDRLKVVLGHNYQLPDKIFEKALGLRDKIKINDEKISVIGFYEAIGNPQDDSNIYITDEGFEFLFPDLKDEYAFVVARVEKNTEPIVIAKKAEEKLRKFKGQKEGQEDFYIQSYEQLIETFNTVLNVINVVLVLIALISLVVAGVNISNTMYTSVLERTKEIGIMKAIGAKNSDIAMIFLFEAGVVGLVGGIFGVLLGYLIAKTGGSIASNYGYIMLQPFFPLTLIVGCLLFSTLIGVVAGVMPAHHASKMNPADSLRYE